MIASVWLFASVLTFGSFARSQFGNFDYYEIGSYNGRPNYHNGYPNNPFLGPTSNSLNSNNEFSTNNRQMSSFSSACDNYWSVLHDDYNENYGLLTVPSPNFRTIVLRAVLSVAAQLQTNYVGEITLAKDKQNAVDDISNGLPILYRVKFPLQNPIPKLTAIYYNDQQICSAPKEYGQIVTTITLEHTLYTGLNNAAPQRPFFTTTKTTSATRRPEPVEPPSWMRPQTIRRPHILTIQPNGAFDISDFECGIPDYRVPQSTGLIYGGFDAARGQFPWLAAYYHNNEFICGGSLISTKIVVTAAHCVQAKGDPSPKKAEDAFFLLGKHDRGNLNEQNFIWSAVSQLTVHPEWKHTVVQYDSDIAIAVISKEIVFNKFVKPICLWTASTSYADIIGATGVVAGWGKTEDTAISTNKPKYIIIPVVSEGDCLRSNNAFTNLTSSTTFCAGIRNKNSGPCRGDSGGGFVIESGGKWFLRGVVSSSLVDFQSGSCDIKNYAVFTDATQFTSWLQNFIKTHG